jgi:hypothetical protein
MMYHGFLLILPLVSFFSSYVPLVRTATWPSPSSSTLLISSSSARERTVLLFFMLLAALATGRALL